MKSIKRFLLPLVSAVANWLDKKLFNYGTWAGFILEAAHTAVAFFSDGNGTTYSISAALPATYDSSGYGSTATVAFTLIGKPKAFPQFGSKRAVQEWHPISGGVEKGKGQPNYGGGQATFGDVPALRSLSRRRNQPGASPPPAPTPACTSLSWGPWAGARAFKPTKGTHHGLRCIAIRA